MLTKIFGLTLFLSIFDNINTREKILFCEWGENIVDTGGLEEKDYKLCTHLMFKYAVLGLDGHSIDMSPLDPKLPVLFRSIKKVNPSVKLILGFGGKIDTKKKSEKYHQLIKTKHLQEKFIDNSVQTLIDLEFDGLNWEWDGPFCWISGCTSRKTVTLFKKYLEDIRKIFRHMKLELSLTLSGDFVGDPDAKQKDLEEICRITDYLMLHSRWTVAKLTSRIRKLLNGGAISKKVVISIPLYNLINTLGENSTKPEDHLAGLDEPYVYDQGLNCNLIKNESLKVQYSIADRDPYVIFGKIHIRFVHLEQLFKLMHIINEHSLAGIGLRTIRDDDRKGVCYANTKFPMLKAANIGLNTGKISINDEPEFFSHLIFHELINEFSYTTSTTPKIKELKDKFQPKNTELIFMIVAFICATIIIGALIGFIVYRRRRKRIARDLASKLARSMNERSSFTNDGVSPPFSTKTPSFVKGEDHNIHYVQKLHSDYTI